MYIQRQLTYHAQFGAFREAPPICVWTEHQHDHRPDSHKIAAYNGECVCCVCCVRVLWVCACMCVYVCVCGRRGVDVEFGLIFYDKKWREFRGNYFDAEFDFISYGKKWREFVCACYVRVCVCSMSVCTHF